ncbi:MAG: hypothetical protein Q8N16_03030 [bacterium]|nr:hypothetical protein [bacterium]
MKTNKALIIIYFFFIGFLFVLPLTGEKDVQAACPCNGTAGIRCRLDEDVASGDSVDCDVSVQYANNCTAYCNWYPCDGAAESGDCTISAGNDSCTVSDLDCLCYPFRVTISAEEGSVTTSCSYDGCDGWGGYPYYASGYHWVGVANPSTCTITCDYTPGCSTTKPVWSSVGSSNITANSATLDWALSSWGEECSCSGAREYETHLHSGSTCSSYLQHWSFETDSLTRSKNVTGLAADTTYSYFVWAMNKCYVSDSSTPNAFSRSSCHSFTTTGACNDSCTGYQLVDYNSDCVRNSTCGTQSTRYTGGECSVCPLNNNSCSSKYPGNTQTSGNCVIPGNMRSSLDFTISHNVTFPGSAALTVGGNLILNSGGRITAASGATVVFYIGKEIRMQGGRIDLTGGYILNQIP